jgi:hypothetical protein
MYITNASKFLNPGCSTYRLCKSFAYNGILLEFIYIEIGKGSIRSYCKICRIRILLPRSLRFLSSTLWLGQLVVCLRLRNLISILLTWKKKYCALFVPRGNLGEGSMLFTGCPYRTLGKKLSFIYEHSFRLIFLCIQSREVIYIAYRMPRLNIALIYLFIFFNVCVAAYRNHWMLVGVSHLDIWCQISSSLY